MNALVAADITVAFHGFLLRRIPPTVEWKLRALARRASFSFALILALSIASARAEDLKTIALPAPHTDGGMPLMQALKERKSSRAFSPKELPPQILSDMLWAACGINRPDSGLRTNPTALNLQEIDVYVVKADGVYLYDYRENALVPALSGDLRSVTGAQPFVKDAPVNLVFVADYSRMDRMEPSMRDFYAATDTGYISQNVYLYCASAGLATVVRGWVDKRALEKAMKLDGGRKVMLCQTVGYPAE
jgi:SagB-type dehydrogenase family enzyme